MPWRSRSCRGCCIGWASGATVSGSAEEEEKSEEEEEEEEDAGEDAEEGMSRVQLTMGVWEEEV